MVKIYTKNYNLRFGDKVPFDSKGAFKVVISLLPVPLIEVEVLPALPKIYLNIDGAKTALNSYNRQFEIKSEDINTQLEFSAIIENLDGRFIFENDPVPIQISINYYFLQK